jgi:hypothetical protein
MAEPFSEPHEQRSTRFNTPEEELIYLRAQVAEKERQLTEQGHQPERGAVVYEALQQYKDAPAHEVLHESHQLSQGELHAIVLDLPPDNDDGVMAELIGVLQEKGIKNALTVAEQLTNPHLEDDFHRMLVQYVAHGHPVADLPEKGPLWNVLNMTLFEVTLPEPSKEEERPLKEIVSAM